MIEIKNLSVKYYNSKSQIPALDHITLSQKQGEICALIGPSGCGKSTLLHVLSGIVKDYSGEVLINSNPVNPKKQRIGLVPQNFGLLEWETVYENAVMGLKLKGDSIKQHKASIERVLEKLKIAELQKRYPSQLSGGQRQRISIARSFILQPDILLMDEPFSALDAITREETQDLFMDLWKSSKVTTFFVTHSIEEALYIGQRIAIFSSAPGRILRFVDNPLFGAEELRFKQEFYHLSVELRKIAKEEWSK